MSWVGERRMIARITWLSAIALASWLLTVQGGTPAPASPSAPVAGCAGRSIGTFKHVVGDRATLTVGPLMVVGGAAAARVSARELRRFGGWKLPVLVRPGHRVTIVIASTPADRASMHYRFKRDGSGAGPDRATTFVACARSVRHDSRADGRQVTFWSGFFTARRYPVCIPLEVSVDGETTPRHVVLSLGAGRCAGA